MMINAMLHTCRLPLEDTYAGGRKKDSSELRCTLKQKRQKESWNLFIIACQKKYQGLLVWLTQPSSEK